MILGPSPESHAISTLSCPFSCCYLQHIHDSHILLAQWYVKLCTLVPHHLYLAVSLAKGYKVVA